MAVKLKDLEVGDIVVYSESKVPKYLEVIEIRSNKGVRLRFLKEYDGEVLNHGQVGRIKEFGMSYYSTGLWAFEQNYTLVQKKDDEKMAEEKILWKVIGEEKYGTKVGVNAEGHYVLDLNGSYAAYPKDQLEEVIPYTIGLVHLFGTNPQKQYHYQAPKDFFKVGDIIRYNSALSRVSAVNTKYRQAEKSISPEEVEFLVFEKRA